MPKRMIVVVLVAVAVVAIVSGMVASSLTAGGGDGTHAMPDGSTMRGDEMP